MSTRYTPTGEIYRPTEAAAMRELVRSERERAHGIVEAEYSGRTISARWTRGGWSEIRRRI